jgi:pimeloyl-ACP methyl ester carboxylesterase
MATFVLVHGGWAGGWVWQLLTPFLRAAGHEVHTPTLTGLGERVHLGHAGVDLDTHITDILNVLEFENLHDVMLVGWSLGGTVTTGVADRNQERLAQLVALDATIPQDGESFNDCWPEDADAFREAAAGNPPGFLPVPISWFEEVVTDAAVRDWLLSRMVPHPFATLEQPIRLYSPATSVPCSYIRCIEQDEAEPAFLSRIRADPDWRFRELAADHMAPVTAPHETAEMLLSLV